MKRIALLSLLFLFFVGCTPGTIELVSTNTPLVVSTLSVESWIATLKDKDPSIRFTAATYLGIIRDARAVEPLIAALKDEDSLVRSGAATSLGEINDARAVEPLIAALKDEDSMVRFWAAQALGRFKDARAVETLVAALKDGNLEIIAGAYSFFIARGENGTEVLLINALNAHGFSQMAEDFLNSNNALLSEAALQWAKNNGYIIRYGTSSNSSGWGSNP